MCLMPEQTITEFFLTEIRAEMGRQKISQRQLGRMLGWPSTTTHHRLSGRMALSVESLLMIADVLCVPASSLGLEIASDHMASGQWVRS